MGGAWIIYLVYLQDTGVCAQVAYLKHVVIYIMTQKCYFDVPVGDVLGKGSW